MTKQILFKSIDERISREREEGDQTYFNALLFKLEFLIKVVAASIVSCLDEDADRNRYSLEYELVRANSLGVWVDALDSAMVGSQRHVMTHKAQNIVRDLTEKVSSDSWKYSAVEQLRYAAEKVGVKTDNLSHKVALRSFFDLGVQIRNRTRGHGAPTITQCTQACVQLNESIDLIVQRAEIFRRQWVHLHKCLSGKYHVTSLMNETSAFNCLKSSTEFRFDDGVYFALRDDSNIMDAVPVRVPLIYTDADVLDIHLPNGNYKGQKFEALSFVTNTVKHLDGSQWSDPPSRLPKSETEGGKILEQVGNVFTNTPPVSTDYITRKNPENFLLDELKKFDHHPIVTLTGPGGIGKTSIAIATINQISKNSELFDVILWISARDIDLLDSGPKPVTRKVFTEEDISRAAVDLLEPKDRLEPNFNANQYFERCMSEGTELKTLFVFDNFETLKDPLDIFNWIDRFIRLPNKVLITTRIREFQGDYPIEVHGMSKAESEDLIERHARKLGIWDLLSQIYIDTLISESSGHPYAMKILLAAVDRGKQLRKPERVFASDDQLLDALFERTFGNLKPISQRIFLLLSSWRVPVPTVAVEAVSLRPVTEDRPDVSSALDELTRFSLVDRFKSDADGTPFVEVPLAATIFGRKKLKVSPYKVIVEEDRKLLIEFGAGERGKSHQKALPRVEKFFKYVATQASDDLEQLGRLKPILEYIALQVPRAYLLLVELNRELDSSDDSNSESKDYIRKFIQHDTTPKEKSDAWEQLAKLCRLTNDTIGEFHALGERANLHSTDLEKLGEISNLVNSRIKELKDRQVDIAWSDEIRIIVTSVIQLMEKQVSNISATDCSRLAWLHLNVGNSERAHDVAKIGIRRDPMNDFCIKLLENLEQD